MYLLYLGKDDPLGWAESGRGPAHPHLAAQCHHHRQQGLVPINELSSISPSFLCKIHSSVGFWFIHQFVSLGPRSDVRHFPKAASGVCSTDPHSPFGRNDSGRRIIVRRGAHVSRCNGLRSTTATATTHIHHLLCPRVDVESGAETRCAAECCQVTNTWRPNGCRKLACSLAALQLTQPKLHGNLHRGFLSLRQHTTPFRFFIAAHQIAQKMSRIPSNLPIPSSLKFLLKY